MDTFDNSTVRGDMTNEQLQQAIDKEEKALEEYLQRANQEAAFRRGRIAALKDMQAQDDDEAKENPAD